MGLQSLDDPVMANAALKEAVDNVYSCFAKLTE